MSVKTTRCFVVTCDGCGDDEFGADYTQHWDSLAEAEGHAESNDVFATADGKHYCDQCIESGSAPADVLAASRAASEHSAEVQA